MVDIETTKNLTDEAVVAQTLLERSFFEILVTRYEVKIARYIERLGVRVFEDRQDILQEIFIKVYKNLNGFDRKLSFSSWLYRIAHNETISWYRKRNVRPEGHFVSNADDFVMLAVGDNLPVEQLFDTSIDSARLNQALAKLDDKYRGPIILRFYENKAYEEISDILKIPTSTVGTYISRGKKKLLELMLESETKKL